MVSDYMRSQDCATQADRYASGLFIQKIGYWVATAGSAATLVGLAGTLFASPRHPSWAEGALFGGLGGLCVGVALDVNGGGTQSDALKIFNAFIPVRVRAECPVRPGRRRPRHRHRLRLRLRRSQTLRPSRSAGP